MSKLSFEFTDNSPTFLAALDNQVDVALTKCGIKAREIAVKNITTQDAVDTGLLRNSITYALGGGSADTKTYMSDDGSKTGSYSGTAPADSKGERSVRLGSNVEYALYIEMGTGAANVSGGTTKERWFYYGDDGAWHCGYPQPARPYIKPAIEDNREIYKTLIENTLKGSTLDF